MSAKISENGLRVLEARYLRRDSQGRVMETPDQLLEEAFSRSGKAGPHFRNQTPR